MPEGDVKAAAAGWGFDGLADDATAKDLFLAIAAKYDWNFSAMEAETAGSRSVDLLPADVYATSTKAVTFGESAANITGIQKTGDTACVLCSPRSPLPPCISWAL